MYRSLEEIEVIDFEAIEQRILRVECSQRVRTGEIIEQNRITAIVVRDGSPRRIGEENETDERVSHYELYWPA